MEKAGSVQSQEPLKTGAMAMLCKSEEFSLLKVLIPVHRYFITQYSLVLSRMLISAESNRLHHTLKGVKKTLLEQTQQEAL